MHHNILLEIRPYIPGVGPTTIRLSSASNGDSAGTQLDGYEWHPLLTSGPTYSFTYTSEENGLLTTPTTDLGSVQFRVGEIYDNEIWSTYDWNNAQCRIWIGEVGQPFAAYRKEFEATSGGWSYSGVTASLTLRALTGRLDKPLLDARYAGTGGAEGATTMKGKVKPMALGNCLSVEPVVVDAAKWIFQVHGYGPVQDIVQVYDFAQPLEASVANVQTYEALAALELTPGQWAKCNSRGMFRLGGSTDKKISADVLGGIFDGQFPDTVADIVPALLGRAGFAPSQIGSFASLPHKGWSFYSTEDALIGDIARKAVLDAGGYLLNNNEGDWAVGNAFDPKPAKPLLADGSAEPSVGSIVELNVADPVWQFEVGYDPCWAVHSTSDISPKLLELAGTINEQAEALDEIRDTADLAREQSRLAQVEIENIYANGILDRAEKYKILAELENTQAQRRAVAAIIGQYQAAAEWTAYQAAHDALIAYYNALVPPITDTEVATPADRATGVARWAAYSEAHHMVWNAMAGYAKTVSLWTGVSGPGKPEDNATVGAPVGTMVGNMRAEVLLDNVETIGNDLSDLGLEVEGIGGKVEVIDTDLEDAKAQITDLFTTYGSTADAATNAQVAIDAARDSNAAKGLAEVAKDASEEIEGRVRDIESNVVEIEQRTNDIRGLAQDAADAAGDALDNANDAAQRAFDQAGAAAGHVSTAAGHAGFAEDKADEASGYASTAKAQAQFARSRSGQNLVAQPIFPTGENLGWPGGVFNMWHDPSYPTPKGHTRGIRSLGRDLTSLDAIPGAWRKRRVRVIGEVYTGEGDYPVALGFALLRPNGTYAFTFTNTKPARVYGWQHIDEVVFIPDEEIVSIQPMILNETFLAPATPANSVAVIVTEFFAYDVTESKTAGDFAYASEQSSSSAFTHAEDARREAGAARLDRIDAETAKGDVVILKSDVVGLVEDAGEFAGFARDEKDLAVRAKEDAGGFADAANRHRGDAFNHMTDAQTAAGASNTRKLEAEVARDAARRAAGRTFVGDFFNEMDFWQFADHAPASSYFYEGGFGAQGKTLAFTLDGQPYTILMPKQPIVSAVGRRWRITVNGIWTPNPQNHPNSYVYLRGLSLSAYQGGPVYYGGLKYWGAAGQNQLNPFVEFVTTNDEPFYPQLLVYANDGPMQAHIYSMTCKDITEEWNAAQHAQAALDHAENAFAHADAAGEQAGFALRDAGIANTAAGTANTHRIEAGKSEKNANDAVIEAQRLQGLSATTLVETRDILHRSWPPSFTDEGRRAYESLGTFGGWEGGHGGGDPLAWHNYGNDTANARYVSFLKSRPTIRGRRYRVTAWVWQNIPGPHLIQIYAQSGANPDGAAGERYHGTLTPATGLRTNVPAATWTKMVSEFETTDFFMNHWRPAVQIYRSDNQPFGGDWYATGMLVEDITAVKESESFAAASSLSAETARVRRDEAGDHAEAARLAKLDAQTAYRDSNTRAGEAELSRVEAGKHEANALRYSGQSAEFRDSSQSAYNRFLAKDGNLDLMAGWDGWQHGTGPLYSEKPDWVVVEDGSFGRGRHLRFNPHGGGKITSTKRFGWIPGRILNFKSAIAGYSPNEGGLTWMYFGFQWYDINGNSLTETYNLANNRQVLNGQYIPVEANLSDADIPANGAFFRVIVYMHWNGGSGIYAYLAPITVTDITSERAAFSHAEASAGSAVNAGRDASSAAREAGLAAQYKVEAVRGASAASVPPFMQNSDFWYMSEGAPLGSVRHESYLGEAYMVIPIQGNSYGMLRNRHTLWVQPGSKIRMTSVVQNQNADCPGAGHYSRMAWIDGSGARQLDMGSNHIKACPDAGVRVTHVNEFVVPAGVNQVWVENYIYPSRGDAGNRDFVWWSLRLEDVSALKSAESFAKQSNDAYVLADGQRALAVEQAGLAVGYANSALNSFALTRPNGFDLDSRKAYTFDVAPDNFIGPEASWPTPYLANWAAGRSSWEFGVRHKKWLPKQVGRRYRFSTWVYSGGNNIRFFTAVHSGNGEGSVEIFNGFGYDVPGAVRDITPQSAYFQKLAMEFTVDNSFRSFVSPYLGIVSSNGQVNNGGYHVGPILLEDITNEAAAASSASLSDSKALVATDQAGEAFRHAQDAAGFVEDASGFAEQARGSATRATDAETTTSNYLTQMSSFGAGSMVKNGYWAAPNWTGMAPPLWGVWGSDNGSYIGKYAANSERPNPFGPNALQMDRGGNNVGITQQLPGVAPGWYVIEADLWVQDGLWAGVGIHCQFNNGTAHNLDCGSDPDINDLVFNGNDFRNRKFSKLVYLSTPSPFVSFYAMASWGGFTHGHHPQLGFARTIWHKALLRPATRGEIDGSKAKISADANTAAINEERQTRSTETGALAGRTTTVEARATTLERRPLGGGNWLADTEFPNRKRYGWWTYEFGGALGTYGVNEPGNAWAPLGENALSVYQSNAPGETNGMSLVSERVPVIAGTYVQHYVWAAAHRAPVETFLEFFRADGSLAGYGDSFTGWQSVGGGGRNPGNYSQVGRKFVRVPDDAIQCQLIMRKMGTTAGNADSYGWFWRPYLGPARDGQVEWNPYVHGSGKLAAQTVEARVTTTEGAVADINGAAAFYETVVAASGSTPATIQLKAGKNGSAVNLIGEKVSIKNPVNGQVVEVARFENGIAQLNNAMIRRLRVAPRSNSQIFLPVMLRPMIRIGSDGQWINYQNGESFGANPERIVPDLNGLPALAAGESYDIRAINVGHTGFQAYAKKITAADPVVQNSGAGANVGGTPQWRADKPTALDAYNGNYQFTFQIVGQLIGSEPAPGGGGFYDYRAMGDIYLSDTAGNMQLVGNYNEGWGGFNASGTRYITVTVTSNMPVGQTGNYEFGVHPTIGAISAFDSVIYATQVQSNVSSLSSPISWVISPPSPDE